MIKLQYKFAIFCENLKILCRVLSEILDLSQYLLDDPRTIYTIFWALHLQVTALKEQITILQ